MAKAIDKEYLLRQFRNFDDDILENKYTELEDIAPEFSTSTNYAVGDYVNYEGSIYKCTTAHSAGAWVAGDFTAVVIGNEVKNKMATDGSNAASHVNFSNVFTAGSRMTNSIIGRYSSVLGSQCVASGDYSHAEGYRTNAGGDSSHAEGYDTESYGNYSHAEGYVSEAGYDYQHVSGRLNNNKSTTLFEIGNGTSIDARSNAFEVYSDGKISQDDGTTKFKFTSYNNQDGYYDSSDTFHAFTSGGSDTNSVKWSDNTILGAKNFWVPFTSNSYENNGITFTQNADKSVSASGTASATALWRQSVTIPKGSYIISGGLSSDNFVALYNYNTNTYFVKSEGSDSSPYTFNADTQVGLTVRVGNGETLSDEVFYPMIRIATDTDDTYAPYAMTNRELTNAVNTGGGGSSDITDLAPAFSTSTAYAVGDYVTYNDDLYRCTTAHAAGAWAAGDFTQVTVGNELKTKMATDGSNAASHVNFSGAFTIGDRRVNSTVGNYSFVLGHSCIASGDYSYAKGHQSVASGVYSHADGWKIKVTGNYAYASGCDTIASQMYQHVCGEFNNNKSTTLFEIGNGIADTARSNAFEVYSDGTISQDDGTTKFKFTSNNGVKGYYDENNVFNTFGSDVSIAQSGTATSSTTRTQQLTIDNVATDIVGTKYMETTITLSTSASTTATFTNAAITNTSAIEVFAGRTGGDDTNGGQNVFPYENVTVSVTGGVGTCEVEFPKFESAISLTVRIYIK